MDPKPHALRLVTINSNETPVPRATRTVALLNPDTGRPLVGVEAVVRILEPDEVRGFERKHQVAEKTARGVEFKTNQEALIAELLVAGVESWTGILGADHKPMRLCGPALMALDPLNKAHLAAITKTPAEVVDPEVVEASFRQPAGVGAVVGG